jgi:hypothetical protein
MCAFCDAGQELDDAKAQLAAHGYEFLQPNARKQFGVAWDGRVVAHTEKRERAVQMASEQNASNPGSWEAVQRSVGAWTTLEGVPMALKGR